MSVAVLALARLRERLGTLVAMAAMSFIVKRIEVAKLYGFDNDRDRLFRRVAGATTADADSSWRQAARPRHH